MDFVAATILGVAWVCGCYLLGVGIEALGRHISDGIGRIPEVVSHWLQAIKPLPPEEDLREPTRLEQWLNGPGMDEDDLTREHVEWCYRVVVDKDKHLLEQAGAERDWDQDAEKLAVGAAWAVLRHHKLLQDV